MLQAELHVHIEGTLEPQLMFDLAKRNSALDRLPFSSVAEAQAAYSFHNLQSFLDLYYAGCAVLLHKQAQHLTLGLVIMLPRPTTCMNWRRELPA